jgi:hypothetical protein
MAGRGYGEPHCRDTMRRSWAGFANSAQILGVWNGPD